MKQADAIAHAINAGATMSEIEESAIRQRASCRSVPSRNMVRALSMHTWHNTKDDWIRLSGALRARNIKGN